MIKYNNPCNIRWNAANKWLGQVGKHNGFCKFISPYYGYRAFLVLCRNYYHKYNIRTIQDFIQRFAPPSENNTSAYCNYVVSCMSKHGFDSKFDLSRKRLLHLACYVTIFENGYIPERFVDDLRKVVDTYSLHL